MQVLACGSAFWLGVRVDLVLALGCVVCMSIEMYLCVKLFDLTVYGRKILIAFFCFLISSFPGCLE
jgi:hypothetical protein